MDEKIKNLLRAPNFAHIATARRDGSASVTPVWVDLHEDLVLINGMPGRAWPRNLDRDPRITVSVSALDNPYECATLRGRALAPTTDDAEAHFRRLFEKYRARPLPAEAAAPPDDATPGRLLFRVVVESAHYQWQPPPGATAEFDEFLARMMSAPSS
ncbi:TIGR03618 family F420-dependent PPOX class oxidoreductase [Umezawaea tangerina]|uniref:PPOX class probable F420-dependent enzyme n=1 Tax=Umezawaea tangerina TaxID=84725 RepID=A0A2T0STV3_9PSEU|nr:TIGR03618 family F420-dependent PPOX class oxidoreductase [Umezawaea tangerina]PRY36846.1 PPOX class probable F420-dependent enzyme [Umezawaea tangerina]